MLNVMLSELCKTWPLNVATNKFISVECIKMIIYLSLIARSPKESSNRRFEICSFFFLEKSVSKLSTFFKFYTGIFCGNLQVIVSNKLCI